MSRRWIATFLQAQAAELDAARNTQLAYARDLKDFDTWLDGRGTTLETAARGDVEAYLVHCDAQGLARATRARRLSAIKQLFRFAFEEGWRGDNPAIQIKGPGRGKSLPKTLSVAGGRRAAGGGARLGAQPGGPVAQHLPDGTALCHRNAGQRIGRPAAGRGPRRSADAADPRQGRQGAPGPAVVARPRRAGHLAGRTRPGRGAGPRRGQARLAPPFRVARRVRAPDTAPVLHADQGIRGAGRRQPLPR